MFDNFNNENNENITIIFFSQFKNKHSKFYSKHVLKTFGSLMKPMQRGTKSSYYCCYCQSCCRLNEPQRE